MGTEDVSDQDAATCQALAGAEVERFSVHGNQPSLKVTSDKAVAVRITGNDGLVNLTLAGSAAIRGLCVFMAGNSPQLITTISTNIQNVAIFEAGNQAQASLTFQGGAKVTGSFTADMQGNSPSLVVKGGPCPTSVTGDAAGVVCGK